MRPALVVVAYIAIASAGCKGRNVPSGPPPEVTGLAAVPVTAQVIIGADVAKLSASPIVGKAVEQLLMRDQELSDSWSHVVDNCKIDLTKQIEHVMLALGPAGVGAVGTGPVLMVATGKVSEPDLASCVRTMVGKGGGSLTSRTVGGRTLYLVKDGNRTMHFGFGRADTIVLGTDEAWVTDALSAGKKVTDNAEMMGWLKQVDQRSPVFAVGKVDDRTSSGLAKSSGGQLTKGPVAFVASMDPTSGAKVLLGVIMPDAASAKQLESFAKGELSLLAGVAQMKSLGTIANKVQLATVDNQLKFTASLSMDEVNQLLSVLDEPAPPAQVTPPAQ
ncbi:MAG TPA: hypothetical protein VGM90_12725 [Kofleriaceae bacterium]|jgi:hypothetical protein